MVQPQLELKCFQLPLTLFTTCDLHPLSLVAIFANASIATYLKPPKTSAMSNEQTYQHYDAPEAYTPNEVSPPAAHSGLASPASPPPLYANEGMNNDARYSTYKPGFVPTTAPVPMGDAESQPVVVDSPKRFKDKRVCGIPMLWFIALLALLVIIAAAGGAVGGVLGTKKKTPAPPPPIVDGGDANGTDQGKDEGTGDPITTTSSSTSSSPTPTPTEIFRPRTDSWYYIKNDLINPDHPMVLEIVIDNSTGVTENATAYYGITEPRGDPYEFWGFWPVRQNSTYGEDYRERMGIEPDLWVIYNRGHVNIAGVESPTQANMDTADYWYWFDPHPVAPYQYFKGAYWGTDMAFTIFDNDSGAAGDDDRFDVEWNRTALDSYPNKTVRDEIRDGQAWKIELAFKFLDGELGIWDKPPAATASAV